MKTLSLVMITKNEELKIRRCLESVKDFVSEIIVVDTGSIDKTKEIALEFGAKIFDYKWNNNFSDARNFAIRQSTGDWNLILDADEFITNLNIDKIDNFINSKENIIGKIKVINLFEQDNEIKKSNAFISRLAPKGVYFEGSIHEQLNTSLPREVVDIEIQHDGYLNTNKFDRNITLLLNELKNNNSDSYLLYQAAKTYYSNNMYMDSLTYFDKFYEVVNFNTDNFFDDAIILYIYNLTKVNKFEKGLEIIDNVFDLMNNSCDFYFACGVFFTELVAFNPEKYMNFFNNIEICYLSALKLGGSNNLEIVDGTGTYLAAFNLGLFYELLGDFSKALKYYKLSYSFNYSKALVSINRIKEKK
ncbi:glycosyltransferase family 2 protein [Paraclostridium bifermentans]|uniref:Glycosyltransferase family 2 protein n=1 Tax=Paraclostridium bifermentans TaxID=1490 RepID=A0A5P3XIM1_PARBF|nr:glycosyltransferase family 2 protein [Paraclostridium bifermentans]QEZ70156.1 glycosyltransferase family 2 protein [Paraclostridium bifermentans]